MPQTKALLESALSLLMSYITAKRPDVEMDSDARVSLRSQLEDISDAYSPDLMSWPYVRHQYYYDVYLSSRRSDKTITPFDLVRPGLSKMVFSEESEYFNHMVRISESRRIDETGKECSSCRRIKPPSAFKRRGGAKCNACRSKEYRARKNRQESGDADI